MRPIVILFAAFLLVFTGSGAHKTLAASKSAMTEHMVSHMTPKTIDHAADVSAEDNCCTDAEADTSTPHASCAIPLALLQEVGFLAADLRCQVLHPVSTRTESSAPSSRLKRPPRSLLN